jgi:DNA-binding HxlR family transcriptional regulator
VLDALRDGGVHFLALLRAVDGVSRRMLTHTLRELERDGLVERSGPSGPQGKVTYELTTAGHAARRWLDQLV